MRTALSLAVLLTLVMASRVVAGGDEREQSVPYGEAYQPMDHETSRPLSLYERIARHFGPLGREVREEFEDGPCRVERHWETDGDYEERIKCRGPKD